MFREEGHRPSDRRDFVHKRIFGGVKAFVTSGFNPLAGVSGFLAPTPRSTPGPRREPRAQPVAVVPQTFEPVKSFVEATPGVIVSTVGPPPPVRARRFVTNGAIPRRLQLGGGGDGACPPPLMRNPATGNCIAPTSPRGAEVFMGEATMGRYGAGIIPGSRITDVAVCPSGAVLGKDGICYDHLPNRDRMYPRGRRPLLTGGDMSAISRASRAGKKLDRTNARLRGLGLMKPEAVRKRKPKKVC